MLKTVGKQSKKRCVFECAVDGHQYPTMHKENGEMELFTAAKH